MTLSGYRDHPLRSTIKRILDMQSAPEFADPLVSDNETMAFERDRIFALAEVIQSLLDQTPPLLASFQGLSVLQGNLQAPLNELTAFLSNKNTSHISNAAAQMDQTVQPHLWGFAPQFHTVSASVIPEILSAQANTARESIRQLVLEKDSLASQFQALAARADEYAVRLEVLTDGAAKERAEAAAAVAKLDESFSRSERERATAFEANIEAFREKFETLETQSQTDSRALLAALEAHKENAARIVQVVGNIGVTGNYQQIAKSESDRADFWRWVTLIIFAAGIAVAGATFVKLWAHPLDVESAWSVAIRLLYAIAITAPAWYTAKESARHRTNADRARQTELELASIGPFIELMPDEKKHEIREILVKSYFGRPADAHTINSPLDFAYIKEAIELVKACKK